MVVLVKGLLWLWVVAAHRGGGDDDRHILFPGNGGIWGRREMSDDMDKNVECHDRI